MLGSRHCAWAVAAILIATACQVNSKVPPKFIRATRGASKAIYGTRSGYPIFSGPRKLVVGSTSLKREIGSPPSSFTSTHGRRVRRRKTVKRAKKPSRRPSSVYGVPVYAGRYKYYAPSRPVRYKTRAKPVAKLKLRMPTYTQLQDPDDYEEEDRPYIPDENYDPFDETKPQVMSVAPIKTRPRPVITVVHKIKKKKKRPKPKSTTPRTEDDEEDTRDEDEEDDERYHSKPPPKPHKYHTEEPPHRYHSHKYTHDSDGSYTQTPTYKEPSKFIPPYILASNNYGGSGAEHDHVYQNHGYYTQMPPQYSPPPYTPPSFTPPVYYQSTFNPHQYRATGPADTDIGFGQGMEYVADKNPSPWK